MKSSAAVLKKLRMLMKNITYVNEPLNAYIITDCDSHSSEYLADCDKRRDFVSGFTGSSGTAIVTDEHACLWTDGRYFIQASKELDSNYWTLMKEGSPSTPTQEAWLVQNLPEGSKVGVDPRLMPYNKWVPLQTELESSGLTLIPVTNNLIDIIWENKPNPPCSLLEPLPLKYSGKTSKVKVDDVRETMKEKKANVLVLTALDEIAWLLNIRGSDIEFNPVFFSYAAVTHTNVHLFIDMVKITPSVKAHFSSEGVDIVIHPYEQIQEFMCSVVEKETGRIWISHDSNYTLVSLIPEKRRLTQISPVSPMKAIKNEVESQGLINCHIRDAAALCCYFAWLENNVGTQTITEVSGAEKLEEFRKKLDDYIGLSFTTISSVGPNAAITHYRPEKGADRVITTEEVYLCDSGAQFRDGTTDVTRTLHFGSPKEFERECFTRVLKGQIYLATAIFPSKIKGNHLDTLARKYLWDVGLDYMHGTGHGIGMYLNVHEGPMGISWRPYPDDPGLQEGMFLSNEPGFYQENEFGIRLENIVRIVKADPPHNFKNRGFLTFETVTMVPIQRKMLIPNMLTEKEVAYLNAYHTECREKVGPLLKKMGEKEALDWLNKETMPIG
ncbi:hypothetical protein RUM43_007348 [Polyplax serrata]|uniref:Xaa-Pro aminopeptidase 1 n=1 Tax=Polyplax serrata TaxID=468196 RepID=A0AAN8S1G6_POLSC